MTFRLIIFVLHNFFLCHYAGLTQNKNDAITVKKALRNNKSLQQNNPKTTVLDFLKWYKANEERLGKIKIVTGDLQDTTTFYAVDFKGTEIYLDELKKSDFLSAQFINTLRQYFVAMDKHLKKHPQNDGPIADFDLDLVMKANDYMDVWENLDNAKVISNNTIANKTIIKLQFAGNYKTTFQLTKHDKKWLLDRLDNNFLDK